MSKPWSPRGRDGADGPVGRRHVDLLATLHGATSLRDLSPLKSVGLHKLKGDRRGQWAMTVNGPWRLCFRHKNGDAFDVEIINYHKG